MVRCQGFDGANLPVSCPQCQPVDSLSARDCAKRDRRLADGRSTQDGVNGGVLSQTACRSRASYRQLFSNTTPVLSELLCRAPCPCFMPQSLHCIDQLQPTLNTLKMKVPDLFGKNVRNQQDPENHVENSGQNHI